MSTRRRAAGDRDSGSGRIGSTRGGHGPVWPLGRRLQEEGPPVCPRVRARLCRDRALAEANEARAWIGVTDPAKQEPATPGLAGRRLVQGAAHSSRSHPRPREAGASCQSWAQEKWARIRPSQRLLPLHVSSLCSAPEPSFTPPALSSFPSFSKGNDTSESFIFIAGVIKLENRGHKYNAHL